MKQSLLTVNLSRIKEMLDVSSSIGTLPQGGLCRLALSDEDKQMRDIFIKWLQDLNLQVRVDDFGNIYGRREGKDKDAPAVVVGSHLDTQPQGGRFDGILGVLSALEVIRVLNDCDIETKRPIEIVNFTNEEGARFEPPMLGSGGVAGVFDKDFILNLKDSSGKRFGDELQRIGYAGSEENRIKDMYGYVELHIEQGPVLERENISIAAVEGIQGITWLEVRLTGQADHAGPTPMSMRKDALVAAAKMIVAVQQIAKDIDDTATTTVGRLSVAPGAVNCVPGEVVFTIDIRHFNDIVRERAVESVLEKISTIAAVEGVGIEVSKLWEIPATAFSQHIVKHVIKGAEMSGYSVRNMVSGAGHDAKYMNHIVPSAMIFVPSVGGKSHCPEELTLWEDIEKGANVLLYVVHELAQE
ncbi:Zn-dependent hydrolase [Effusibacillus lacus]|uniref:Zn-dependent hydrolase n=1 Tax=Effusibacillus lacus TaxID=1348429 RepID=A0A292YPP2_9BACL|nr:Zn-dependent hydrolase [Effusibacillus lacus]TCS72560.1 N-carbamoyl-L-amino-acid hydrolase [Effusibacillus lacus]GAX90881.1 Zn-dependent hydrolase [Effusibacillus lacus]